MSNYIFGLKLVCGRPPITDGIDELTLKRVYEVGEEVTLTCEQGYLPSTTSPQRMTCTATGEWTQSDLACSREFKRYNDYVALISLLLEWCLDETIEKPFISKLLQPPPYYELLARRDQK